METMIMGIAIILMLAFIGYETWKIAHKEEKKEITLKDVMDMADMAERINAKAEKTDEVVPSKPPVEVKKEVAKETPRVVETTVKEDKEIQPPCIYGEKWRKMKEPVPWSKHRIADRYLISNMGNVWDKERKRLLKIYRNGNDMSVTLHARDGSSVARKLKVLVATTFIGVQSIHDYKVVNNDNNIKNCAASNLRWKKIEKGGWHRG